MMGNVVNLMPRAGAHTNAAQHGAVASSAVAYLPISNETPAMRFKRAYHDAAIARAAHELHHARYIAWLHLEKQPGQVWQESPYASDKPLEEMRALVFKMAVTPATTRAELASKKSMIGRSWLKAKGEVYDAMRAGIEIDELRLAARRTA